MREIEECGGKKEWWRCRALIEERQRGNGEMGLAGASDGEK